MPRDSFRHLIRVDRCGTVNLLEACDNQSPTSDELKFASCPILHLSLVSIPPNISSILATCGTGQVQVS
jgi:hypothetical protein